MPCNALDRPNRLGPPVSSARIVTSQHRATANMSNVNIGDRFSREHVFTPQQVMDFSLAAGDDNPLHLDAAFASASAYGGLIASGTHTTAILLGLTASHFSKITSVVGRRFTGARLKPARNGLLPTAAFGSHIHFGSEPTSGSAHLAPSLRHPHWSEPRVGLYR